MQEEPIAFCCVQIIGIHEVRLQPTSSRVFGGMYAHLPRIHRRIQAVRLRSLSTYTSIDPSALGYVMQHVFGSRN